MTVSVLWLFLTVPWADLQCVIVVFPDHTHFLLICDTVPSVIHSVYSVAITFIAQ